VNPSECDEIIQSITKLLLTKAVIMLWVPLFEPARSDVNKLMNFVGELNQTCVASLQVRRRAGMVGSRLVLINAPLLNLSNTLQWMAMALEQQNGCGKYEWNGAG